MPDIREALLEYTADQPPASFGFDQVRAAGRRARWRRRVMATGVVVAAVAGVVPFLRSAPEPAPVPAGPGWSTLDPAPFCRVASAPPTEPAVTPTTVVNEKNGYPINIPAEPAGHAAARFSCYLARAVPERLPGFVFHHDPNQPAGTLPMQAVPKRVFDPARPADTVPMIIGGSAAVADERGAGSIGIGVSPTFEEAAGAAADCTADCTVRTGPHGEVITVRDIRQPNGYRLINLTVYRGGTTISAGVSNGIPVEAPPGELLSQDALTPSRPGLPLTVDDLVALATDPALTLQP